MLNIQVLSRLPLLRDQPHVMRNGQFHALSNPIIRLLTMPSHSFTCVIFVHCKGDPTFPLAYAAIAVTDIQRLNTMPKRRLSWSDTRLLYIVKRCKLLLHRFHPAVIHFCRFTRCQSCRPCSCSYASPSSRPSSSCAQPSPLLTRPRAFSSCPSWSQRPPWLRP